MMKKMYTVSTMQLLCSRCCWKVDNKSRTSWICHDFRAATENKVEEMKWCPGIMPPFSKLLKAPKLPVSTWLTPKVSRFPLPLSSLPLEWNGDRGLVKTESADSLYPVIRTSVGFTEAKKEYKLDPVRHLSVFFPSQSVKLPGNYHESNHASFEQWSIRLLNFVNISLTCFTKWLFWTRMSPKKRKKFDLMGGLRSIHSEVARDGLSNGSCG